jgi:hypothetical protein
MQTDGDMGVCSRLYGIWIISNEDLYLLIENEQDEGRAVRFFTLRSVTFLILLICNALSMYIMKWFKVRYPDRIDASNFSLIFKNLTN